MPTWFIRVMDQCESLALDSVEDRQRLWERLKAAMQTQIALATLVVAHGGSVESFDDALFGGG